MKFEITDSLSLSLEQYEDFSKLLVHIMTSNGEESVELYADDAAKFKKIISHLYGLMQG